MKYNIIFSTVCACLGWTVHAQPLHLQPTPQKVILDGNKTALPTVYDADIAESCLDAADTASWLPTIEKGKAQFRIAIGTRMDKKLKAYKKLIPQNPEGYYLSVTPHEIVVAGNDERGTYYGIQTLKQLLAGDSIYTATVTDYPDLPYRGVVEGFYGAPWSHAARLRQLVFYGRNKLNTYIYGPKDDPYHSSPNWRKPYPPTEAAQLKELVETAHRNHVDFVWAIHPGKDIRWNEADRDALMSKFESMYQLGVRAFAVFFDDISGEGTRADRQAELLNYIDDHFVKVKKDVKPLVMCPTEYNKSWSNVKGGYLTTLGERLNPTIEIMWTGDRVIACIDKPTMEWINPLLKRRAYIWWNFPVSDYVRDHLLLGPVYGNATDIATDMSGFVANPMEHAEASKIALYSVADYTWNLSDYESDASWRRALADLMPQAYEHLQVFASHSSDLGPNGHGFRRDESVALQPLQKAIEANVTQKHWDIDLAPLADELKRIVVASDMLQTNTEAQFFVAEARPWLKQFKLLGEYGLAVCDMYNTSLAAQKRSENAVKLKRDFENHYHHARALQQLMFECDATENQNPYQPGVKIGTLVLQPTIDLLFSTATELYNQTSGRKLDSRSNYSPCKLNSDVPQLANQPVSVHRGSINVSPSNEVIKWPAGAAINLTFERPLQLQQLTADFGTPGVSDKFSCEASTDGHTWIPVTLTQADGKTIITCMLPDGEIHRLRLTNRSDEEVQVYFKRFSFKMK